MPYLNMDDNYPDHPKIDRLSDGAFRLHTSALFYAAKNGTDGFIPSERIPRLIPKFKASYVTEIEKAGLWHSAADGYRIHDFLDWNKPRAWWSKKRADDAERKRQWREEQAQARENVGGED